MIPYTYSLELPSTDPEVNRRQGFKLPRNILLPPYLANNPYYTSFMDTIDEVFQQSIDGKIEALQNIRNPWWQNAETEALINDNQMLSFSDWRTTDRTTLVKQVNSLGLRLQSAGSIGDDAFRAISRFLGTYWLAKGEASAVDFMGFCLNSKITIDRLWSNDYVAFLKEGDAKIGSTIFDSPPGEWFPTTHVLVTLLGEEFAKVSDPSTLGAFFYEIANYNLVLQLVVGVYEAQLVDQDGNFPAKIVCTRLHTSVLYNWTYSVFDNIGNLVDVSGNGAGHPVWYKVPIVESRLREKNVFTFSYDESAK